MRSAEERTAELRKYDTAYRYPEYRMGVERLRSAVQMLLWSPGGSLLDVGCGRGELLPVAEALGFAPVHGIEPTESVCDGVRIRRGIVQELPFPDQSYGTVVCLDVLEHILPGDEEQAISELWRVASKRLLISISNITGVGLWIDPPQELHVNIKPYAVWEKLLSATGGMVACHPELWPYSVADTCFWEITR